MGIVEKESENIKSKLRVKNEFQNKYTNTVELNPFLWRNKYQPKDFNQCTYAIAWTWSVVRCYFGSAQIPNIKEQSYRI